MGGDSMMGFLLGLVLAIAWVAASLVFVIGPTLWFLRGGLRDSDDRALDGLGAAGIAILGLVMLLVFGAVATGDLSISGVADGCYHVYEAGSGKSRHTEYDPIPCPWTVQP